jgi:hypothetical protein
VFASQAKCRGFESHRPLHEQEAYWMSLLLFVYKGFGKGIRVLVLLDTFEEIAF